MTWPSQILIQAGRNNEGVATKVSFEPDPVSMAVTKSPLVAR